MPSQSVALRSLPIIATSDVLSVHLESIRISIVFLLCRIPDLDINETLQIKKLGEVIIY